ncbi:hypothetical protein ASE91_18235 [Sphingomonas sp. Leaf62]|nr:hypothetical protein ASE91_18235 [Sphingomonas sp. Leaf62]
MAGRWPGRARFRSICRRSGRGPLPVRPIARYGHGIRKDPVQFRVAIPAADPPDNIAHDLKSCARSGAMWLDVDFP